MNRLLLGGRQFPLSRWRAAKALAAAGTRNAIVACVGDSTVMGFGTGGSGYVGAKATKWPTLLAPLVPLASASSFFAHQAMSTAQVLTYDPGMAIGAGWSSVNGSGVGGGWFQNSTTTNAISWTASNSVTDFKVWYLANPAFGSFTIDIDGGAATTIDSSLSTSFASATISASAGTHTINIKRVSGLIAFVGAIGYTAVSKEISIYDLSVSGAVISDAITNSSTAAFIPQLKVLAPDLTIICMSINDGKIGTPSPTYAASMQTLIDAATLSGDILLLTGLPSDPSATPIAAQRPCVHINKRLGAKNHCPVIDQTKLFGSWVAANAAGYAYDQYHQTNTGAVVTSNALAPYLNT